MSASEMTLHLNSPRSPETQSNLILEFLIKILRTKPEVRHQSLTLSVSMCLRGKSGLLTVRIPQISLDGEVLSEMMQAHVLDLSGLAHVAESGACREGNRSRTGQDFRRVVEENFIHDIGGEGSPVYGGSAFDHQAGDFEFSEPAQDRV